MIIGKWERCPCQDRKVAKELRGYWYRPAGSNTKWWLPECEMRAEDMAEIAAVLTPPAGPGR